MAARRTDLPSPDLLALLDTWLPARRWYPVKGVAVRHVPWLSLALDVPDPAAHGVAPGAWDDLQVALHLVRLVGDGVDLVVQVPLVLGPPHDGTAPPTAVGEVVVDGRPRVVHDGAAHPAAWAAVLAAATWEDDADRTALDLTGGRALAVEQSNSSVLLPGTAGGTMLKLLRAVAIGPNPDVTIPRALARQGWPGVPRPLAWLEVAWDADDDPHPGDGPRTAHLAILGEFVDGARDGFDLACAYAGQDESFADLAVDLGRLLADLHGALRSAFGVGSPVDVRWLLADLRRRSDEAVASSAALGRRAAHVAAFWDRTAARLGDVAHVPDALPRLQTVHGDLHLGQVLHARRFGWKVLDFEGEPLRPVAERTRPDLALRDVAGIVRSFDYAAAVGRAPNPGWAVQARNAFLEAYDHADTAGVDRATSEVLVRALTLDKALYEVVYESRNRPDWEPIPLAAVDRLLASDG
ncbi:aminoglycoside phosphotransferase [Cellulosimicrobium marinum]|uniref:aminoglycoside phosphotransferase n=1 Tax=Cellulosimicrobium marinum TaxID=1638992 RepID=UPI001E5E0A1D|nr:aminoglycoside phosphotransferase [Cellulosimicrobium marinum]MCB7138030.1 aminoglycoside phosphotransferase [Cellulosimicrobium marinum]